MKNKMMMLIALVTATFANVFAGNENEPTVVSVDVNQSKVTWIGKKVTGEHQGSIELLNGGFQFTNDELSGGNFTIDMTSITNTDIEDAGMNKKLVGHLKSDDFFGVEEHPVAKLSITSIVEHEKGKYHLTGNLTIKGITRQIEFPASIIDNGSSYSAVADLTIDRSEFNVKYGSGSFFDNLGDKMIYDDFDLKITLVANK